MLVLTRKRGEAVLIGGVRVSVVQSACGRVKLGFEAPREVVIVREELLGRPPEGGTTNEEE